MVRYYIESTASVYVSYRTQNGNLKVFKWLFRSNTNSKSLQIGKGPRGVRWGNSTCYQGISTTVDIYLDASRLFCQ